MLPLRRSVADLSLFCEKCLQPLRAEQALTKEQEAAVFSNWEVIRGVNQQLLDALSAPAPEDPLVRAAAAFESMAPWLKSYSVYSANFVTAQEKLDKLRSESAEVDKACGAVETLIQMSLGSMLIKPVQRLCKYPLLFRELLHEIPEGHVHHDLVLRAARAVTTVAAEVNETVREAERRDDLVRLAAAVGEPGLITPHRALLLQQDFLLRPNRRASLARRASLGGASSSNKGRLWLCTDLLLLGKPSRASGGSHKIYERCAIGGGVMLSRYREGVTLAPRLSAVATIDEHADASAPSSAREDLQRLGAAAEASRARRGSLPSAAAAASFPRARRSSLPSPAAAAAAAAAAAESHREALEASSPVHALTLRTEAGEAHMLAFQSAEEADQAAHRPRPRPRPSPQPRPRPGSWPRPRPRPRPGPDTGPDTGPDPECR